MAKATKTRRRGNSAPDSESNGRLRALLEGKASSDLAHINDTIKEHGELQKALAERRTAFEKTMSLAQTLRIEIAQLQGAADKCVRDVIRWDPQLGSK